MAKKHYLSKLQILQPFNVLRIQTSNMAPKVIFKGAFFYYVTLLGEGGRRLCCASYIF